tara:strand:+ start:521 stop:712 length:192 start_codon:yes stop_codon:yes gene_type:complete
MTKNMNILLIILFLVLILAIYNNLTYNNSSNVENYKGFSYLKNLKKIFRYSDKKPKGLVNFTV